MAITIKSRPYDGKAYKILPVYNGLPFAVDSTYASTPNFKYIAEIYVGETVGSKIGELRHNPDVSGQNAGIFDVGRVIEDYILWTNPYNIKYITAANNSALPYYVAFGEEYTRVIKPSSLSGWALDTNATKIAPKTLPTISKSSSYPGAVYIEGSLNAGINGFFDAYQYDSSSIIVKGHSYAAGTYGDVNNITLLQGEKFTKVSLWKGADGGQYFILSVRPDGVSKTKTDFSIGDKIFGKAAASAIPQMENIDWTISNIVSNGAFYDLYTNIPYSTVAANTTGWIVSKDNYVFRNLFSTIADKAVATNGVEQYDTYLTYQATPYIPNPAPPTTTAITSSAKFLTKRKKRSVSLCSDEYFTLSAFGPRSHDKSRDATKSTSGWMVELWLKTNPYTTPIQTTLTTPFTYATQRVRTILTGNIAIPNGSIITVSGWRYRVIGGVTWLPFTTQTKVMSSYYNQANNTTQIVYQMAPTNNYPFLVDGEDATHKWTLKVDQMIKYYPYSMVDIPTGTINVSTSISSNRVELPAGPKNLSDAGVAMSDVSKYYIYPVYCLDNNPQSANKYLDAITLPRNFVLGITGYKIAGERFEVIIDCDCTRYTKYSLTWLNELGGWDWFTFDARTDKTRTIEKATYDRRLTSYNGTAVTYNYGDKGRSTYNTKSRDVYVMRSRFLSQDELDWLSYIYESPEVYLVVQTKTDYEATTSVKAIPLNITNTDVELYNKINVGDRGTLYQYTITAETANERTIQRGSNFGGYFYNRT